MSIRLDTELSTVNESINRLHEQSLTKIRKMKKEIQNMKVIEIDALEGDNSNSRGNNPSASVIFDHREIEESVMIRVKDYLRRMVD